MLLTLSEFQILITLLCMSADDEDNNTLLLTNTYIFMLYYYNNIHSITYNIRRIVLRSEFFWHGNVGSLMLKINN